MTAVNPGNVRDIHYLLRIAQRRRHEGLERKGGPWSFMTMRSPFYSYSWAIAQTNDDGWAAPPLDAS
jgi:hypothetical protein